MVTSPKVSVLISCYNHAQYIEAAITSVLRQTYANIELIVLDDGSSDNSYQIIRTLADQHQFYAARQQNIGLTASLNKALQMATGKYICQLGSDDIMMPDKTEKQVAFMEGNSDAAVNGGNALLIDENGVIINHRQKFPPYREIAFAQIFANTGPGIIASTCMIRKSALDKEGGWDGSIPLEDMYMWFKLTSRGYRMVGLNDVLIYYRKHTRNASRNVRYMYESMMKTIAPYQGHAMYSQVYLDMLRRYFLTAAKHDKKLAREILRLIPLGQYNVKTLRGLLYLVFH